MENLGITVQANETWQAELFFEESGVATDLSDYTLALQVRSAAGVGGSPLATASVVKLADTGYAQFTIEQADLEAISNGQAVWRGAYDLRATLGDGSKRVLARGPFIIEPAVTAFDPDALAVVAAFSSPSPRSKAKASSLVSLLKAAGVWSRLDCLYVLAAHDAQAARVDWKDPLRVATVHGAPVFTADVGYAFDGVDDYLATGFVPNADAASFNPASHDVMLAVVEASNVNSNSFAAGARTTTASACSIRPRGTTGAAAFVLNSGTTNIGSGITDSRGLTAVQRESSSIVSGWKNGASIGTASSTASGTGLSSSEVYIGGYAQGTTLTSPRASTIALFAMGGRLTADQHAALWEAWSAYAS